MDKEDVVYIYNEYYSAIKKYEISPFAVKWMDLEDIMVSEINQRQTLYDITYMWNLKYDRNGLIYETKTDSQI